MGEHGKIKSSNNEKKSQLETSEIPVGEEHENEDEAMAIENSHKVVKRRRKKQLYQALREQMEFYFSDANLRKDRFLKQLIDQNSDSYVPLDVFLGFNKIRMHTNGTKDLAKACSHSDLFEVNEEKTMVRRNLPVVAKHNVDECTIYIEKLPPYADHAWIKSVFSQFGLIEYVSLPRYKSTEKIKGFAFVEFETSLSVTKACKFYREMERLPDDTSEPPKHKRKRGSSENEDDGSRKRSRCNTEESETVQEVKTIVEEVIKEEPIKPDTEINLDDATSKNKTKSKRKRNKKAKVDKVEETPLLRVMAKNEWKMWKNKYLSLQKVAMSEMKKSLLNENNIPPTLTSPNRQQMERNVRPVNTIQEKQNTFTLEFQKGVVVKLTLPNPVQDASEFRKHLKEMGDVAYVDIQDDHAIFVRCKDPISTEEFKLAVQNKLDINAKTLLGDDEIKYWEKIHLDRENKSRKNNKKGSNTNRIEKKPQKISTDTSKNNRIVFDAE